MYIWLVLAILFAILELLALWKNLSKLEYIVKPAVMVCLFIWLYNTGLQGHMIWFGLGVLFSLIGDVLLMISLDRMFIFGLIAFLFAHLSYLVGFQNELMTVTVWSFLLIAILSISAVRVMRRIVGAMRAHEQTRMVVPVILYSTVITVMLYAAMTTLSNLEWKAGAALLVSVGAFLFYFQI